MKKIVLTFILLVSFLYSDNKYLPCEIKGCKLKCTAEQDMNKINIVDIKRVYLTTHGGGTIIYSLDLGMEGEKKIITNSLNGTCELSGLR